MTRWRRILEVDARDRRLLAVSTAVLIAVAGGLALLPFATLRRLLDRWSAAGPPERRARPAAERVAWAVAAASRHLPLRATCLVEALAAHALLRREGYRSALRFGLRAPGAAAASLDAHAWVECDGRPLIGTAVMDAYTPMVAPGSPTGGPSHAGEA